MCPTCERFRSVANRTDEPPTDSPPVPEAAFAAERRLAAAAGSAKDFPCEPGESSEARKTAWRPCRLGCLVTVTIRVLKELGKRCITRPAIVQSDLFRL